MVGRLPPFITKVVGSHLSLIGCDGRWLCLPQPLNLIDLAAIVPFYAHVILLAERKDGRLGIFRLLRLAKVFRVLKMVR